MSESRFKVVEGATGNLYYTGIEAESAQGEKVIAPKPGEDGLSQDAAYAMCATTRNRVLATLKTASTPQEVSIILETSIGR